MADKVIKIDHHIAQTHYGDLVYVEEESPSCCQIITKFAVETGLRLNEPQKAGATFNGWQILDENGNVVTGVTVNTIRLTPAGNITLKALWA